MLDSRTCNPKTCNIAFSKCLIQIVASIRGVLMIQKGLREKPPGNQHLRNFDATHDLTKASTTKKRHIEVLAIPLATPCKKWPCFQLNHPFQNPKLPLPHIYG